MNNVKFRLVERDGWSVEYAYPKQWQTTYFAWRSLCRIVSGARIKHTKVKNMSDDARKSFDKYWELRYPVTMKPAPGEFLPGYLFGFKAGQEKAHQDESQREHNRCKQCSAIRGQHVQLGASLKYHAFVESEESP